jgi:HlyD family secretion protein
MKDHKHIVVMFVGLAVAGCGDVLNSGEENHITLTGNIELKEVDLAFKRPGKIVELQFEEGDLLEAEQLIAKLDDEQLQHQKDQALAQVRSARSRREELEAAISFQQVSVEAQISEKKAGVRQAEAGLEKMQTGSRQQEVEAAEAAVNRAEAEFRRAESDWVRAQELYKNEDISAAQYAQYQSGWEASEAQLNQAREQADLVREGARSEDIEIARAALERAEAALKLAESMRLDIVRNKRGLGTLDAEISRAEAQVALLESQISDTVLHSNLRGIVLSKSVEEGEVVAAGVPVLTVGDLDRPWVRGYIPESQLGRIRLGDKVDVRTDSYPNKIYQGRISFIASEAEYTPKQIQSPEERIKLVYRIKVDLPNQDQELKLNMPVSFVVTLHDSIGETQAETSKIAVKDQFDDRF